MIRRLHLVTDDGVLVQGGFARTAGRVLERFGEDVALHLRGPRTGTRFLFDLATRLLPADGGKGALVVNDRVDIALAVGIDRVHLGGRSLPAPAVRQLLGARACIGCSVHGAEEARQAAADVDYWMVGSVFETASHPGRPGAGPDLLRAAADAGAGIPVIAIGGISPTRVSALLEAGAHGIAVLSGVWRAGDPVEAIQRYLEVLQPIEDP